MLMTCLGRLIAELGDLFVLTSQSYHLVQSHADMFTGYGLTDLYQATLMTTMQTIVGNIGEPMSSFLFTLWNFPVM